MQKKDERPINGDLKKYFDYQVGTYWIMRDSISGRVDSFFVASNTFYSTFNSIQEDDIGIQISEFTNGHINPDSILWGINLVENGFYFGIGGPGIMYITNGAPLFGYPITSDPYGIVSPSYTLDGNTYTNVIKTINDEPLSYYDSFYINENAGFIKIMLNHNHIPSNIHYVWELQRKYIVH